MYTTLHPALLQYAAYGRQLPALLGPALAESWACWHLPASTAARQLPSSALRIATADKEAGAPDDGTIGNSRRLTLAAVSASGLALQNPQRRRPLSTHRRRRCHWSKSLGHILSGHRKHLALLLSLLQCCYCGLPGTVVHLRASSAAESLHKHDTQSPVHHMCKGDVLNARPPLHAQQREQRYRLLKGLSRHMQEAKTWAGGLSQLSLRCCSAPTRLWHGVCEVRLSCCTTTQRADMGTFVHCTSTH